MEHIRLERDGDRFVLEGGGPMGTPPSRESVVIDADGALRHIDCPAAMRCVSAEPSSGFLASAAILAAIRHGGLTGKFAVRPYGDIAVVCIPAERIGIPDPDSQIPASTRAPVPWSPNVIAYRNNSTGPVSIRGRSACRSRNPASPP